MKKTGIVVLAAVAIALNTSTWIFLNARAAQIWDENGPMENFQAACLGLTLLLSLVAAKFSGTKGERIFFSTLALFAASILVLEVDFRRMDAPLLNRLMNGKIRDGWLGALWLIAVIFFVRNMKPVWLVFTAWLRTASGMLMILSGFFWVASALIDKSLLGKKDLFREELMEVNGALLMLVSAIFALCGLKRRVNGAGDARDKSPINAAPSR